MRQALNKSMFVMAAASGILAAVGGHAYADATAEAAAVGSPGVGSGNAVQAPVHVPANVCGNTVDVIAALNPAFGNTCENVDSGKDHYGEGSGATAEATAAHSPGVLSGNVAQAPVHVPANVCGNSVNVVGALNPAAGNECTNVSGPQDEHPPADKPPADKPPADKPPADEPPTDNPPADKPPVNEPPAHEPPADNPGPNTPDTQLAATGAGEIGMAAGAGAALLLGGSVLLRRARASRV